MATDTRPASPRLATPRAMLFPTIGTATSVSQKSMGLRSWRAAREDIQVGFPASGPDDGGSTDPLRVTVPADVAEVLEGTLAGLPPRSCGRCRATCMRFRAWRVRAWCGSPVVVGVSMGYFSLVFAHIELDDAVPYLWAIAGASASAVYMAVGVICAISTTEMARITGAMSPGLSGVGERPAPLVLLGAGLLGHDEADSQVTQERRERQENPSQSYLSTLLTSEISEAASQVIRFFCERARARVCSLQAQSLTPAA